jgi:membrane-associated phospholipid phosphatase
VLLGGLLLGTTTWISLAPARAEGWKDGVLFDDAIQEALDAGNERDRRTISDVSDGLQAAIILYPFVVDAGLVTLLGDNNPELALQLALTSLEAFVVSGALIVATKHNIGRIRPNIEPCEGTVDDFACRDDTSHSSFLSGHSTAAFTAAGLTCVQHQYLPLYDSATADTAACGVMLGLATATSLLRVVANRHWATDAVASAAVGLISGYGLPYFLHFGASASERVDHAQRLHGSLQLLGLTGPAAYKGEIQAAAGGSLTVQQLLWLDGLLDDIPTAVELGAEARLMTAGRELRLHQVIPSTRFWLDRMALGLFVDYRSQDQGTRRLSHWVAGPTLALGLFGTRSSGMVLSGRWAPLLDGTANMLAARVDLALFRWVGVAGEVQTLTGIDGEASRTMGLLGLGGRVPW